MSRAHSHISKGDVVQVTSGVHKGASGRVLEVVRAKETALVEGVRMIKKHVRKNQDHPQGVILNREGPIHISNLKLVQKGDVKPSKAVKTAKE